MRLLQTTLGGVMSCTEIWDTQELLFPLRSMTVMVMLTVVPRLAQVTGVGETYMESMPQLSKEPLSVSLMVTLLMPTPLRNTVLLRQRAVGGVFSNTVTVAEQEAVLPDTSVTRRRKVLDPVLSQV